MLQALGPVGLCESAIERTEGYVTCLPRNLNHHAIRKSQPWITSEDLQGARDDACVLNAQALMVEQHFDSQGYLFRRSIIDGVEHPHYLCQYQVRDPCARRNERLRDPHLLWVVTDHE